MGRATNYFKVACWETSPARMGPVISEQHFFPFEGCDVLSVAAAYRRVRGRMQRVDGRARLSVWQSSTAVDIAVGPGVPVIGDLLRLSVN